MKPNTPAERLYNGIIKENPTFVLMLGMCPTLAITTSATNGIGMGLTTTVILAASNLMISLLRNFIPDRVRMPAFIVVVASFVTVVQLLLQGFIPSLYDSLGIYIPLITAARQAGYAAPLCCVSGQYVRRSLAAAGAGNSNEKFLPASAPAKGQGRRQAPHDTERRSGRRR